MGWLIVIFDLPVVRESDRRNYRLFREFLLDDGFLMIQYSVYARSCVTFSRQQTHLERVKKHLPPDGAVRIYYLTKAQWENAHIYYGPGRQQEQQAEDFPEQLQLW